MTTKQTGGICAYQDCDQRIAAWFQLCRTHNEAKENGEINECSKCGRFKDAIYPLCRNCNAGSRNQTGSSSGKYEPESNPKWEAADEEGDVFFIYLLKLDGGKFYAGHTRELRERMGEHRDGKTRSTAGKNPLLVWFEAVDNREKAAEGEAYFKELIDKNEREVRRIVTQFQDLIKEVHLESTPNDTPPRASDSANETENKARYRPRGYGSRRQTAK